MAIVLTSIWGVLFGILAPLAVMNSDMGIASHHALRVWLVMAVVGYFAPCLLMMFNKAKLAAAFSVAGTGLALYVHSVFSEHAESFMYLPQIFMTILAVIYVFVMNPHYITEPKKKRKDKLNAPAPSILGGGNAAPSNNKKKKHKNRRKK
jgi:hypothetical protein